MAEETKQEDFPDTPTGNYRRWKLELDAAKKDLEDSHKGGDASVRRFLDIREGSEKELTRLNLYTANIQTQRAMLMGKTPQVTVSRKFADAKDDDARVAGEIEERLLNSDIESDDDNYEHALKHVLDDWLIVDMGVSRLMLERGEPRPIPTAPEATDAPADETELEPGPETESVEVEGVATDYYYWKDFLYSPCRVFGEMRWAAFRNEMTLEEFTERFGKEFKDVPLNARRSGVTDDKDKPTQPWDRVEVWEIWDKGTKTVCWYVEGYGRTVDKKPDPYQLTGFWPFAEPLIQNATTSAFKPRSDFVLTQDLYAAIDEIDSRLTLLTEAVQVSGLYDASNPDIERLLNGERQNRLIPCQAWALLKEKGGLTGAVDWFPIEQVVKAIVQLTQQKQLKVEELYQVSGWSDIMRGQAVSAGATATEQNIKARFGSVRMQARQDRFARYASETQKIRAELYARHISAQTIIRRSNAERMFDDQAQVMRAVALIKSKQSDYRIEVKPEAVSMTDFAALKQERMEVLEGIGTFYNAMTPAIQFGFPPECVAEMAQWSISGLRGASQMEGIFDRALELMKQRAAQKAQQPPPPDPKVQAAQMKMQGDQAKAGLEMQKAQFDLQADAQRSQMAMQETEHKERVQAEWNVREAAQKQMVANALTPSEPAGQGQGGGM